ncbi:MAG: family 16 glycosylhydrolase [Paludibacter sp.]|jgi:beta-glucanase (GH16 family)|nr:family 16 glycosylhydrolase [Paludibacter sp.]
MKSLLFLLSGVSILTVAQIHAKEVVPETKAPNAGYTLVWQDNFDGNQLNEDYWVVEIDGNGGGNNEMQYYRRENITVGSEPATGANCLILTAKKENFSGRSFTSGRLKTLGKMAFKYGKIEARIKLPKTANGLWPAFWMMGQDHPTVGWPKCGEIDILEMGNATGITNNTQDRYFGSHFHWGEAWTPQGWPNWGKSYTHSSGIQDNFYLFTLIWDDKAVKTYFGTDANPLMVNVVEMGIVGADVAGNVGRYFHKPFFVLFNLAVGGNYTGITGSSNISKITALANGDASMYIDYVRVYQKGDVGEQYIGPALSGLTTPDSGQQFSIFPNPVSDILTVSGSSIPASLHLIDIQGRVVQTAISTRSMDVSQLAAGVYVLEVNGENGKAERHRMIKY